MKASGISFGGFRKALDAEKLRYGEFAFQACDAANRVCPFL
jgi:hypothetical protein